jgi:rSAM/selenodomain-associated transferase 2
VVSIIVPALNEASHIGQTLRALQSLEGDKEILIVDGGSNDQTIAVARQSGARVLESARGRGVQQHAGAVAAHGDILWFLHADTIPPAHALSDITAAIDAGSVGGNFGLTFDGNSRAARHLTSIYPTLRWLNLCYGDSGLFVRTTIYHEIGGFRPVRLFEDLDLLKRLRKAGRFVHLETCILTSSRRFENRNFAVMWIHWTALQILYWVGVHPNLLARWYGHTRRSSH